jgi:hypothetical protein
MILDQKGKVVFCELALENKGIDPKTLRDSRIVVEKVPPFLMGAQGASMTFALSFAESDRRGADHIVRPPRLRENPRRDFPYRNPLHRSLFSSNCPGRSTTERTEVTEKFPCFLCAPCVLCGES